MNSGIGIDAALGGVMDEIGALITSFHGEDSSGARRAIKARIDANDIDGAARLLTSDWNKFRDAKMCISILMLSSALGLGLGLGGATKAPSQKGLGFDETKAELQRLGCPPDLIPHAMSRATILGFIMEMGQKSGSNKNKTDSICRMIDEYVLCCALAIPLRPNRSVMHVVRENVEFHSTFNALQLWTGCAGELALTGSTDVEEMKTDFAAGFMSSESDRAPWPFPTSKEAA